MREITLPPAKYGDTDNTLLLKWATMAQGGSVLVPTTLIFSTQPGGAVAGEPFTQQPVITVRDQHGATLTSFTGDVTIVKLSGSGALSGDTTVAAVAGAATFTDLELDAADDYVLRASIASPALQVDSNSFAVASGFDPSTVLDIAWWAARLEAYAENEPVPSLEDQLGGGAGKDAVQATGSAQPTFKTAIINGLPALLGDGGDLLFASSAGGTQPYARWWVARTAAGGAAQYFFDGQSANISIVSNNTDSKIAMYAGALLEVVTPATSFHIGVAIFNGASSRLIINGATEAAGNAGASNCTGTTIMADASGTNGLAGYFVEGGISAGVPTDEQINYMGNGWADLYGLTWTDV